MSESETKTSCMPWGLCSVYVDGSVWAKCEQHEAVLTFCHVLSKSGIHPWGFMPASIMMQFWFLFCLHKQTSVENPRNLDNETEGMIPGGTGISTSGPLLLSHLTSTNNSSFSTNKLGCSRVDTYTHAPMGRYMSSAYPCTSHLKD